MVRAEWVPVQASGLVWDRRCGTRVLGRVVFYTMRGANRAAFWRAQRSSREQPRSCFTLQEAIDWVELEPPDA